MFLLFQISKWKILQKYLITRTQHRQRLCFSISKRCIHLQWPQLAPEWIHFPLGSSYRCNDKYATCSRELFHYPCCHLLLTPPKTILPHHPSSPFDANPESARQSQRQRCSNPLYAFTLRRRATVHSFGMVESSSTRCTKQKSSVRHFSSLGNALVHNAAHPHRRDAMGEVVILLCRPVKGNALYLDGGGGSIRARTGSITLSLTIPPLLIWGEGKGFMEYLKYERAKVIKVLNTIKFANNKIFQIIKHFH